MSTFFNVKNVTQDSRTADSAPSLSSCVEFRAPSSGQRLDHAEGLERIIDYFKKALVS